ncbi:hypothetical protein ZOD2009_15316 [Haladaptatus paucihalophilus DX253]|uniref:DUF8160 domain-containing protein n=1 Tax=Haladaptatus paucihalophilus DX253 TaxID=797209 RepID=E7QW75_HALPU|nr:MULTISPECIES: hypothetical protein [Haladaptatus]EFW91209.1 hypothetical protein ZOD2009_15316 [Haladaptatus paucihalophilus DX253]GKZ16368.1 hypothetical protein HAL_42490 [Haladaptatus sp. T7]SHL65459.1 hypothetical protein SAMN05444342_4335 [Haladaptatus paucihalophilus DX253]
MSDESRADRLRRRRAQRDKQSAASESTEPADSVSGGETGVASDPSETDDETDDADSTASESVKETRVGTYMYLPEEQRSELNFRYKELNLAYERAVGEELEKNRHFYPLVVQAGLEALDGIDGEAIRERLDRFE